MVVSRPTIEHYFRRSSSSGSNITRGNGINDSSRRRDVLPTDFHADRITLVVVVLEEVVVEVVIAIVALLLLLVVVVVPDVWLAQRPDHRYADPSYQHHRLPAPRH